MNETLNNIRNRPRYKFYTQSSPEECAKVFKEHLEQNKETYKGNINREVSTIFVKNDNNNYWKPNLALRIEKEDDNTVIRGIFGPSSAVWTFFMFLYFIFSVLWMVFFTLYYVEKQMKTNDYPWALGCSFLIIGLTAITYLAAKIGQYKSKKELILLRQFAEESTHLLKSEN